MAHDLRSRLRIPTFLAVSALGTIPGCGDDGTEDTGNDGPSTTSTSATTDGSGTGTTTGDTGSTGSAATTTTAADSTGAMTGTTTASDSTGAMTGTDTGALPDCQAYRDVQTCEATEDCRFIPELGGCIINCVIIEDEATCSEELGCEWFGESCETEPIA